MEYPTSPEAAYPVEAINTFRGFLARRRQARPSHEYREVTPEEWEEFLGHFAKRKVSIGDCAREYGHQLPARKRLLL